MSRAGRRPRKATRNLFGASIELFGGGRHTFDSDAIRA